MIETDIEFDIEFPEKDKTRAARRKNDISKALRKRGIFKAINKKDLYDNLHEYSKNKIHCSCNQCRFRPCWDPDNKPMQDIRNTISMDQKYNDYVSDSLDET